MKRLAWITAACLTGVLLGGLDATLAVLASSTRPAPNAMVWTYALSVAMLGVPGLLLGGGCALLAASLRGVVSPRTAVDRIRAMLKQPREDLHWTALLLTVLTCLVLLGAWVAISVGTISFPMSNPRNRLVSAGVLAILGVPISALIGFPIYRVMRLLGRLFPRPRVLFSMGSVLLLALGAGLWFFFSLDWRIIHLGPWKMLSLGLVAYPGVLWILHRLASATTTRMLASISALVVVGCMGFSLRNVRAAGPAQLACAPCKAYALTLEHSWASGSMLGVAKTLFDRDHDGYPRFLGNIDCNDHNPGIHPDAEDVPGNGIDEDCSGTDEQVAPVVTPATAAAQPAEPPLWTGNWLIITVDSLRADRVNETWMPSTHALAQRGFWFQQAYAQAPNTPRSFPSFLTSRFPSQVDFTDREAPFSAVQGTQPTLFTVWEQAGFHNVGIFSHFYLNLERGLNRGFALWSNQDAKDIKGSNSDVAAPRIVAQVIEQLEKRKREKFVLWTHLFEPHSTYLDHPRPGEPAARNGDLVLKYNREVRLTDEFIGTILQALKDKGLDGNTAVVIFADHGESMGEHIFEGNRLYFHGETLFEQVLRTPWIVYFPTLPAGVKPQKFSDRVMLVDLAPTLLAASGVSIPAGFEGRSLLPLLRGKTLPAMPAYAEMLPARNYKKNERAFIDTDGNKLYHHCDAGLIEVFDVTADPFEKNSLSETRPELRDRLIKNMHAFQRQHHVRAGCSLQK